MASETNVVIGSYTQTNEIAIEGNNISQVWMGADLLWEKSGGGSPTWQPFVADDIFMVEYTPSTTVTLDSMTMIQDKNAAVYNYIVAVYTATQSQVFSQTGTANVSIITGDTIDGSQSYLHTMTFPSGPTLTAGTSYYLGLGERYSTYRVIADTIDDSGDGASVKGWSLVNATCQPFTSTSSTLYLKVTTS